MINYINIQDLEDFLKAKYEIENYLISSKQIKEKLSIDDFVKYLALDKHIYIESDNSVVPFSIIENKKEDAIYIFYTESEKQQRLQTALERTKYNLKSLKEKTKIEIYNGELDGKEYFIIDSKYYSFD